MRIGHLGCTHFDEARRPDDTERVVQAFLDGARAAEVDLILHGGDATCDQTRAASEKEREWVRSLDERCAEIAPTVRIRGNHDVEVDEGLYTRQRTRHPFRLHTRPNFPAESVADLLVQTRSGLAGIIAIPWFSRAHLAARAPSGASIDDITRAVNATAAGLLAGAEHAVLDIRAAGAVPILLHHGTTFEAESSTGWKPIGETVAFTVAQLREVGCAYVALNHFHNRQEWDGGRISYSGSIEPRGFGEREAKGWNLIEIDGERFSNTFVELPARRIQLLEQDFALTTADLLGDSLACRLPQTLAALAVEAGALVRFRYRIRPEDLHLVDEAAIRQALLDAGAHEVKVEPDIVHEARVRSEAITAAPDTWSKVKLWAESKAIHLTPEEEERRRGALDSLQTPKGEEVAA